ncbi:hypothetical protein [Dietzia sp. JS16-p6b]|nr:hypothetical protein [Dietzia sp. JS16-p6b]
MVSRRSHPGVVGQRVSTAEKEHEVDVLVAMPGAGIVAIELKARS